MIFFQFAHLSAFIPIQERKISLGLLLDSKVIPLRILSSFSLPRFSFGLWSQPTENPAQFLTVAVIGGNWVRVGCDAEGLHLRNCFRRGFICTRRCWSTEHKLYFEVCGESKLNFCSFFLSRCTAATAFASRLVRHSEPFAQTGSGRSHQAAGPRLRHDGRRREAPGLLGNPP